MTIAPAAPEAGLSVGLILLALAFVVCIGLNHVYKLTLGALLGALSSMVSTLPHVSIFGHRVPPWDALAAGIDTVNTWVLAGIGAGIITTEKGMHACIAWMTWVLQATADEVAGLAEDTAKAFDYTKRILIPALLGVALAPIIREVAHLGGKLKTAALHPVAAVHTTVRVIAPGLKALEGKVSALEAKVAAIGAAAPAVVTSPAISIPLPKPAAIPGDITSGIGSLWKRVRGIGRTLTPAGIAGLVLAATSAVGLTWTRCSNTKRYGERLCGMNPDLLETLLADTLLVLGTVSLVEFAQGMQGIVEEAEGAVATFWRA